jgi:Bacterial Ig-like domain (group 3)/Autotransporter beta-domain
VISATTASLASSANPTAPGQSVTFTATVTSAGGTPTGVVTFKDGGAVIGSGTLAGGVATFATTALAAGAHNITASYGGGAGFAASTSSALTQTVAIPADSIKLRQLQVEVTKVVAQNSGQAISGALDNAIADGFGDGGGLVTPSGTGVRFNFSADSDRPDSSSATSSEKVVSDRWNGMFGRDGTSLNDARGSARNPRVDDAFAAIDRNTMATKAPPSIGREPKDWLLWAEVRGSGIDRWGSTVGAGSSPLYGAQVNALMGLTRKLTPNFLVGVVGGYETFDYTAQDLNGKLKGNGWTVGSYLGWKLTSTIRFDAAVAYSGIGYDGTAGTAQGNFDGRRWMVSSGLTGSYKAYGLDIEPSAKIYALSEHENAYTDSLGTQQADRDFATGRASAGMKLAYPVAWADTVALAPYVGIYGDYYFTDDNAAAIVVAGATPLASTPLLDGWSARSTAGLVARFSSGAAIAVGGELGGIGSDSRIWTYRARATVPF